MTRSRISLAVIFLAALAAVVSARGVKIKTEPDKTFNFAGLKTIDWLPEGRGELLLQVNTGEKPEDLKARLAPVVEQEVERVLPTRGLTKPASGAPDLYIHYYILIKLGSSSQEMGQFLPTNVWGVPFNPSTTALNIFETGTLILDIASVKTKALVWRGIASAEVDRQKDDAARKKRIQDAIGGMLKKFPK